jgi:hypothetical protein
MARVYPAATIGTPGGVSSGECRAVESSIASGGMTGADIRRRRGKPTFFNTAGVANAFKNPALSGCPDFPRPDRFASPFSPQQFIVRTRRAQLPTGSAAAKPAGVILTCRVPRWGERSTVRKPATTSRSTSAQSAGTSPPPTPTKKFPARLSTYRPQRVSSSRADAANARSTRRCSVLRLSCGVFICVVIAGDRWVRTRAAVMRGVHLTHRVSTPGPTVTNQDTPSLLSRQRISSSDATRIHMPFQASSSRQRSCLSHNSSVTLAKKVLNRGTAAKRALRTTSAHARPST